MIIFRNYFIKNFRLCGFPPFYSENNEELFDKIKKGTFTFPSPAFDEISEEGNIYSY